MSKRDTLRSDLETPDALTREADHRIKNALQLISSLILLQGRRAADPAVRSALKAVQHRVSAVSLAQRLVRRHNGAELVDGAALVRELTNDLAAACGRDGIEISLSLEPIELPARAAAPLALILNEALNNALTHAFADGRPGRVSVTLERAANGLRLTIADNGSGPAPGAAKGFGSTIVQLLSQQLAARVEENPAQPGLSLAVHVPLDEAQA